MKISTCTNKHFQRKIEVLSEFDSFLMYIDNHTKSHNFLKISMFSNKMFTFSSSAHLFEKNQHFSRNSIFFPKIDIFAQKLLLRKTLVTLLQSFARHDFITVLKNSLIWSKTNTFCIKWYFLPKRNNATWNVNFTRKMTLFPKYHRIKSYLESK